MALPFIQHDYNNKIKPKKKILNPNHFVSYSKLIMDHSLKLNVHVCLTFLEHYFSDTMKTKTDMRVERLETRTNQLREFMSLNNFSFIIIVTINNRIICREKKDSMKNF